MSCLGTDTLESIYNKLAVYANSDIHRRFGIERPEQELIAKFLPTECCVLEFGGESGTTALIVDTILKDPTKHVLVDPSTNSIAQIQRVQQIYNTSFTLVHGFLGRNREEHEKLWSECKFGKMYDLHELESIVKQPFDVLIIDCEGAFYNILNDIPEILNSIKMIIIEHDGETDKNNIVRAKFLNSGFVLVHTQTHPYLNNSDHINNKLNTVNDIYKIKKLIGFHEVYVKF